MEIKIARRQKIRRGLILFSFFLFPATCQYFSPMEIIEASSNRIINDSLGVFCLLFLSSLLFGRGYWGWVCPGGAVRRQFFWLRKKESQKVIS
jgi:ferredoxin-type protein NapH